MGCVSISEADKLTSKSQEKLVKDNKDFSKILKNIDSWDKPLIEEYFVSDDKSMFRKSEKIGRLWLAPYIDKNHNYHEGSYVRVVDESSKWYVVNKNKKK